jgi:2-isopropylmalate synthase
MEHKLRKTPDEGVEAAARAVERAAGYTDDVEFSCEDATRSDPEFLVRVYQKAIDAGATTLALDDHGDSLGSVVHAGEFGFARQLGHGS